MGVATSKGTMEFKKVRLGTHYLCLRAVNTAREHGRHFWRPVNTGHQDRAGAIVNDVIIILYLQDACNSTGYQHGLVRVHGCPKCHPCLRAVNNVNTGSVDRP